MAKQTEKKKTEQTEIVAEVAEVVEIAEVAEVNEIINDTKESELNDLKLQISLLEKENNELRSKILEKENSINTLINTLKDNEIIQDTKDLQNTQNSDLSIGDVVTYMSKHQKMKFKITKFQGKSNLGNLYRISNFDFNINYDLIPEKDLLKDIPGGFENKPQTIISTNKF